MPSPKNGETPEQRERRLERQRAYEKRRREQDPEGYRSRQRAHSKKWREKNIEKSKAIVKAYSVANRAHLNEKRREWRKKNIVRALYGEAKSRSKRLGIEFDLSLDDIPPMGQFCPIFGTSFTEFGEDRTTSPSLDRIDPSRGYVKGNVWVISYRANRVKNDATAEEHEMIAAAMRKAMGE